MKVSVGRPEPSRSKIQVLRGVVLTPRPLHWAPTGILMGRAGLRTAEIVEH
jgi:hypothetical protein